MNHTDKPKKDIAESGKSITVEWGTPLMLRFRGFSESHKCVLVGMERGVYLICRTPPIAGLWAKLRDLDHVTVRYLYEGVAYGFKCTLLSIINEPFHLLILSYPREIEVVRLRKSERISCLIPAAVKLDTIAFKGAILDLSEGGCAFAFPLPPEDRLQEIQPGKELTISMHISGSREEEVLRAVTVNTRKETHKLVLGCRFSDPGSGSLERIHGYVQAMAVLNG